MELPHGIGNVIQTAVLLEAGAIPLVGAIDSPPAVHIRLDNLRCTAQIGQLPQYHPRARHDRPCQRQGLPFWDLSFDGPEVRRVAAEHGQEVVQQRGPFVERRAGVEVGEHKLDKRAFDLQASLDIGD